MGNSAVEWLTWVAVLVFYLTAFGAAYYAHRNTKLWARRVSTAAILIATLTWILFYIFIAPGASGTTASRGIVYSRIAHYINATALFVMAFLIHRADKYGIDYKHPVGETDE